MGRHPPENPSSSLLHAHTLDWDMDRKVFDNMSAVWIMKIQTLGRKIHETLKVHTEITIKSQSITLMKRFRLSILVGVG